MNYTKENRIRIHIEYAFVTLAALFLPFSLHAASYVAPLSVDVAQQSVLPPTNPQVEDIRSRSFTVSWTSDVRRIAMTASVGTTESLLTQYTLEVFEQQSQKLVQTVLTTEQSMMLRHLAPNQLYDVRVTAQRNGVSSESSELSVRTAPKKVLELRVKKDVEQSNAVVEWEESKNAAEFYVVKLYKRGGKRVLETQRTENARLLMNVSEGNCYDVVAIAHATKSIASKRSPRESFCIGAR